MTLDARSQLFHPVIGAIALLCLAAPVGAAAWAPLPTTTTTAPLKAPVVPPANVNPATVQKLVAPSASDLPSGLYVLTFNFPARGGVAAVSTTEQVQLTHDTNSGVLSFSTSAQSATGSIDPLANFSMNLVDQGITISLKGRAGVTSVSGGATVMGSVQGLPAGTFALSMAGPQAHARDDNEANTLLGAVKRLLAAVKCWAGGGC